ncbi:hypothetical protein HHL22_10615 [Hymenobacter sp. RP-2-7]|uniref:Immunity protein 35 domain-containing protein n=1 Tax=Hymenobacter polaris TaxID=2682546 RepID=A0A7Y0AEE3_9BACT|nr:YrhB domain-containing protein [Hymenobacter polaris]NML65657.1 hypothetical protein [Hymenobacter polaris]
MIYLLTVEEAIRLAREWVRHHSSSLTGELMLIEEETVTRPYSWFFYYNSKQFLATQDFDYALAGNAPILVDKRGHVHVTGTAHASEHYVAEFDAQYQRGDLLS